MFYQILVIKMTTFKDTAILLTNVNNVKHLCVTIIEMPSYELL